MKSPLSLLLAALLLSLTACAGDDAEAYGSPVPLRECPDHDYERCDTREPACQERLLSLAACVFGSTDLPDVPIRVLSEDELRGELAADSPETTPDDAAENVAVESVLHDLGLVQEGALSTEASIDNLVARFDGLYRDAESGIVLIDRGAAQNGVSANVLLLHELIHALQDAEYDLTALSEKYATTTDSALSLRALLEGQATWYQYRVAAALLGVDTVDFDFDGEFRALREDLVAQAREDPSPFIASFGTFPYVFGTPLAYDAWRANRAGFEADLLASPPLTTLEIMNLGLRIDEPARTAPEFREPTPTGDFSRLVEDTLGHWLLNLCFDGRGLSPVRWLGDTLWIYTNPDGEVAWLWQMQLEHTPSTLPDALEITLPSHVSVEGLGERLFVVSGAQSAPFLLEAGRSFLEQ